MILLGVGLFLVYYQINQLSQEEQKTAVSSIKKANYFWIILAFSFSIFSHLIRAYRWRMLLKTANEHVKVSNAFYSVMIGYLVNGFIPRGGELVRCGVMAKKESIKFEKLVGTVVAERLFDVLMLIVVIGITLSLQFHFLFELINTRLFQPFISRLLAMSNQLVIFLLVAVIVFALTYFLFRVLIRRFNLGQKIIQKWNDIRLTFIEGFQTILKLKEKWWIFLLQSISMWVLYFMMSYVVFKSLSETKHLGVDAGLSVLTSGSLALLIPTPGGLGSYHEFVSRTLQLYDISEVMGVSLSWLIWGSNFSAILIVGFISIILIRLNK